jgi:cellulose synthase/poly-beta-1,6-N-acetylglucosamine synthase-like glycosyltransferase
MDADSALSPGWLATAADILDADPRVGAVCGAFLGEPSGGIVGQIQRNEYFRYARIIQRRWQALVLSGTGTLFRACVLAEISRERGHLLPGTRGQIYNQASITEDDEVTLAVKSLGWRCLCPPECETTTEVMPTWTALWVQRMRWQNGTLVDLRSYGLSRVTRTYWARQAGLYGGFAVSYACLAIMIAALVVSPGVSVAWTAGILTVTLIERTWTVRRAGWRGMLLAALIIPEAYYALWQGCLFFAALRAAAKKRELAWGHLTRETA